MSMQITGEQSHRKYHNSLLTMCFCAAGLLLISQKAARAETEVPVQCQEILERICTENFDPHTCAYEGSQSLPEKCWEGTNLCRAHIERDYFACMQQDLDQQEFAEKTRCFKTPVDRPEESHPGEPDVTIK